MKCPECNGNTGVLDGTLVKVDNEKFRHRRCKVCGYTFWTSEVVIEETEDIVRLIHENHRAREHYRKRKET